MPVNLSMLNVLGGIGIIFLMSSMFIANAYKKKIKRCSEKVLGKVINYSFLSEGFSPIIEYYVDGKVYKKKKRFRGVVTIRKPHVLNREKSAYVSENDWLHISTGTITNYREIAENLYPLNSELPVFYNPLKPKEAFIERILQKPSICAIVFAGTGAVFVLVGILMYFVAK